MMWEILNWQPELSAVIIIGWGTGWFIGGPYYITLSKPPGYWIFLIPYWFLFYMWK